MPDVNRPTGGETDRLAAVVEELKKVVDRLDELQRPGGRWDVRGRAAQVRDSIATAARSIAASVHGKVAEIRRRGAEASAQEEEAARATAPAEASAQEEEAARGTAPAEDEEEKEAGGEAPAQEAADRQGAVEAGEEARPGDETQARERALPSGRLFDGTEASLQRWKLVGGGALRREGDELHLSAADERGLVYFTPNGFGDFRLRLQFLPESEETDIAVAVRFRNPELPVPDREDPSIEYPYDNPAYVASHTGFELRLGAGVEAGEPGTFDGILLGEAPGAQAHAAPADVQVGAWNDLVVEVEGDRFRACVGGKETARFINSDPWRGRSAALDPDAGFVGLVLRKGSGAVRRIELEERQAAQEGESAGAAASPATSEAPDDVVQIRAAVHADELRVHEASAETLQGRARTWRRGLPPEGAERGVPYRDVELGIEVQGLPPDRSNETSGARQRSG